MSKLLDTTMTVDDIPHVAQHLLQKHGLAAKGWRFEWDRARRRAGCCKHSINRVTLSYQYVALNVVEMLGDIIDTILHEIAHALAGPGVGHGPEWRAVCERIGARPERCYDSNVVAMPRGKYAATCGRCGKTFYRHKQTRPGRWIYCIACGPDLGRLIYCLASKVTPAPQGNPPPPRKLR